MLLLIIEAGGARYSVSASRVVEVIPVPLLRPVPRTSDCIAGVFSYHGTVVPVIDVSMLLSKRPARQRLSTRILLVNFQPSRSTEPVLVGLMAEHATETVNCKREEFQSAGFQGAGKLYAGRMLIRSDGLIQELDVDSLLAAQLNGQHFAGAPVM